MKSKAHDPTPEGQAAHQDALITRSDRWTAHQLINAKMSGEKRVQAMSLIARIRRRSDLLRFCERLRTLPDIGRIEGVAARISNEQIAEIRRLRASGERVAVLAERFGTSDSYIYQIVAGKVRRNAGGTQVPGG